MALSFHFNDAFVCLLGLIFNEVFIVHVSEFSLRYKIISYKCFSSCSDVPFFIVVEYKYTTLLKIEFSPSDLLLGWLLRVDREFL